MLTTNIYANLQLAMQQFTILSFILTVWWTYFVTELFVTFVQFVPIKTLHSLHTKFRAINKSFETNLACTIITRD